jgi:carbonic anhydrase
MSVRIAAVIITLLAVSGGRSLAQDPACNGCNDCSPSNPWAELDNGNKRFTGIDSSGPRVRTVRTEECRRAQMLKTQKPYAIVLSCSDSRVPPEIAFDQRLGDLFVVRVAGNVATDEAIGSIEYALAKLQTPKLILVLGHEDCGAVKAALALQPAPGLIPSILNRIFPAVQGAPPAELENAAKRNVKAAVRLLPTYSQIISDAVSARKIAIRGAYYSLKSGRVELVD